jgi:hypothetical protein
MESVVFRVKKKIVDVHNQPFLLMCSGPDIHGYMGLGSEIKLVSLIQLLSSTLTWGAWLLCFGLGVFVLLFK